MEDKQRLAHIHVQHAPVESFTSIDLSLCISFSFDRLLAPFAFLDLINIMSGLSRKDMEETALKRLFVQYLV